MNGVTSSKSHPVVIAICSKLGGLVTVEIQEKINEEEKQKDRAKTGKETKKDKQKMIKQKEGDAST